MKYKTKYTYSTNIGLNAIYQTLPIYAETFYELAKSPERVRRLNFVEKIPTFTHKSYTYINGILVGINKLSK